MGRARRRQLRMLKEKRERRLHCPIGVRLQQPRAVLSNVLPQEANRFGTRSQYPSGCLTQQRLARAGCCARCGLAGESLRRPRHASQGTATCTYSRYVCIRISTNRLNPLFARMEWRICGLMCHRRGFRVSPARIGAPWDTWGIPSANWGTKCQGAPISASHILPLLLPPHSYYRRKHSVYSYLI